MCHVVINLKNNYFRKHMCMSAGHCMEAAEDISIAKVSAGMVSRMASHLLGQNGNCLGRLSGCVLLGWVCLVRYGVFDFIGWHNGYLHGAKLKHVGMV